MTIKLYSNERVNKSTGDKFTAFYTYIKQTDGTDKPVAVKFPRWVNPPICPCTLMLSEEGKRKSFAFDVDKNGYTVLWIRDYEAVI